MLFSDIQFITFYLPVLRYLSFGFFLRSQNYHMCISFLLMILRIFHNSRGISFFNHLLRPCFKRTCSQPDHSPGSFSVLFAGTGYASHLVLDSLTPSVLPIVGL